MIQNIIFVCFFLDLDPEGKVEFLQEIDSTRASQLTHVVNSYVHRKPKETVEKQKIFRFVKTLLEQGVVLPGNLLFREAKFKRVLRSHFLTHITKKLLPLFHTES